MNKVDFSTFTFRASSLGDIIPKSGKLTQTAQSKLIEVYIEAVYDVKKDITSKYFEKGLRLEGDSIALVDSLFYNTSFLQKNTERKSNNYINGECDLLTPDGIVWDIKNNYDIFTFYSAELTYEYEMQLQGYMWLWGLDKARLCYTLMDLPQDMFDSECMKLFYTGNYLSTESPAFIAACNTLKRKYIYDYFSDIERVKIFEIERDEVVIEKIKSGVELARQFLNDLQKADIERITKNRKLCTK